MVVYVQLLGEGVMVFRPAEAECVYEDAVKLLPVLNYASSEEDWEFPPESIVRCENRILGGKQVLVAIARI